MRKVLTFVFAGAALVVLVINIIWSLWITATLDSYANDFALREMPGFELTADILGREIVISDVYRFSSYPGMSFEERLTLPPEGLLAALVHNYESSGMRAATLYFRAGPGKMKRYSVDFPGCRPGACQANAKRADIVVVSDEEWNNLPIHPPNRLLGVSKTVHRGSTIELYLSLVEDARGRLVEYRVHTLREPRGIVEKLFKVIALGTPGPNITRLHYEKNVVLTP